jgi:cysteinyl-tRNA synthetase
MGKSLGNFITLDEFFTGTHASLQQVYSPMTIRFFILQAHYRSTLDFSNEALQAAEKGLKKLLAAYETLGKMMPASHQVPDMVEESRFAGIRQDCYSAMNDDFNSPMVIASLFECVRIINSSVDNKENLSAVDLTLLKNTFDTFLFDILGLKDEKANGQEELVDGLMQLVLAIRQKSRETKDWGTSDQIRDALQKLKITVKDGKEGSSWGIE